MKKIICAVLSACLLIPCAMPFASAKRTAETNVAAENKSAAAENTGYVEAEPFVIIRGMEFGGLIKDPGTEKEEKVRVKLSFSGIVGAIGKALAAGI